MVNKKQRYLLFDTNKKEKESKEKSSLSNFLAQNYSVSCSTEIEVVTLANSALIAGVA
mgnify:CR=1 FL=1